MVLFDSSTRCWCGRLQTGDTEKEIYLCGTMKDKGCNLPEDDCECEMV